jgi:hypothetical protein
MDSTCKVKRTARQVNQTGAVCLNGKLGYMKLPPLPPLVGKIVDGAATWDRLSDIDYSTVGYLLCCHLVLENYIEAYMQAKMGASFSIEAARLTFGQKISMLGSWNLPDQYNFMPSLKHLNSLRNKLGHNIRTVISENELLPLIQFLEKASGIERQKRDALSVLNAYTGLVCAWLAASYVNLKEGPNIDDRASFEKWGEGHLDLTRASGGPKDVA